jgi:hypothetical protein
MIQRWRRRLHTHQETKIGSDPELQAFIDDLLPHSTFAEIAEECRQRFGPERTVGRSTIHRYFVRKRAAGNACER